MALGAPVDPGMASAVGTLQGQAPADFGMAQAAGTLAQYAPQTPAPDAAGPGLIAPDPYIAQANEKIEEQKRFEAEHGKFATVATQAARGVLDFVLAPAALVGAAAEGTGSLTGWQGLQDFGRDFGSGATGNQAMATLFGSAGVQATKSLFGAANDPERASTAYERTLKDIHEQQEAWPMLSTISHLTGLTAAALLTAGAAAAPELAAGEVAPTAIARIGHGVAMGAYEGSSAGAQTAYMENRPLRDVLGSTLMGGLMGAATAGVFQAGAEAFGSHAFADGLEDYARVRTFKALGGAKREATALGRDGIDRIADDVGGYVFADGSKVFPSSVLKAGALTQEDIAKRIAEGAAETGQKLGDMRRSVSEFIDSDAPELRPNVKELTEKIGAISEELSKNPQLKSRAGAINDVLEHIESKIRKNTLVPGERGSTVQTGLDDTISLNDLREVQESLKSKVYTKVFAAVPEAKEELQRVERIIEGTVENTVDRAVPKMGTAEAGAYRDLRRQAQSFIQAKDMSENAVARQIGNRAFSLSDNLAATAALAGDVASGGGIGAAAKALGAGAVHKYAREHGSAFMAALANKLAENSHRVAHTLAHITHSIGEANLAGQAEGMEADARGAEIAGGTLGGSLFGGLFDRSHDADHVSVDAAGGREAQSVIAHLSRAREKVNAAVEAAGPNPVARQNAQALAQQNVSAELATRAGPYDPTTWTLKAPSPLQKVLHRPEILNQVSADLAQSTAHAAALHPSPDFELNADRVKKLTKDADGPTAIGGVQQAVRELGQNAPATPTGDQIRMVARQALQRLSESDVPDAMTTGHEIARQLAVLSDGASDQITKAYVARQTTELQQALSDKSFGKAGEVYGRLTATPSAGFQQLLDQASLRDSLKNAQSRGQLPAALKDLATNILDAHEAKKQLGGGTPDRAIAKQLKDTEDKFSKAEDAVTLDGGPAGRVFDHFSGKPGADASGLRGSPEMIVLNAVRPQMERLLPVLGKQSDRYTGEPERPSVQDLPRSSGDLQSLYSERMKTLAQAVSSPDPDSIAASMRGLPNVPPSIQASVGADAQQRMATLLQDMPKPTQNVRGKAFETLSSDDLRKANAMWEATTKPMSVFADFHSGTLDYDKSQYVWKQYPGLQQAAQAGMMDCIHAHLSDDERAAIPDSMLTQLDYLLGFNGTLQTSVDRGFSSRMTAMAAQQDQEKPKQNGPLDLETSKPTYTERLAGAKG